MSSHQQLHFQYPTSAELQEFLDMTAKRMDIPFMGNRPPIRFGKRAYGARSASDILGLPPYYSYGYY